MLRENAIERTPGMLKMRFVITLRGTGREKDVTTMWRES
jgi:hypothetical protein